MPSKTQTFMESFGVFSFQQGGGTSWKFLCRESFTEEKISITVSSVMWKFDFEYESFVSPNAQDFFFSLHPRYPDTTLQLQWIYSFWIQGAKDEETQFARQISTTNLQQR